jgi:DNA-damage-inducible protein J
MCIVLIMHMFYFIIVDILVVKGVFCMSTVNVTIRMDDELKKQAEDLFSDLGLSMTAALIAFTKQAVREQRIPFNISRNVPNLETISAIEEVERMKFNPQAYKGYDNVDDMMRELLK